MTSEEQWATDPKGDVRKLLLTDKVDSSSYALATIYSLGGASKLNPPTLLHLISVKTVRNNAY